MAQCLVYLIYNLLFPLFLIVGIPGYIVKGIKRGNLRRNFAQRFGQLPASVLELKVKPLWVHAVSVGEVLVAAKIIRAILQKDPRKKVVLTTTTTTGYRVAEKELANQAIVIHNPVDLPMIVRKVVRKINPEKLILVESEVWPNLVNHLKRKGIPVLLANARLSPRSEGRYRKVAAMIRPIFQLIDKTSVPFDSDVARWSVLGIKPDSITVTGSVKFDESAPASPDDKIQELNEWLKANGYAGGPIFLAGSTHAGEEFICGEVWKTLQANHPDLTLVIVPRHAERAPKIGAELQKLGLSPIFRSAATQQGTVTDLTGYSQRLNRVQSPTQQGTVLPTTVFVSDTTGELRAWFHLARVVFIGKSLTGKGGQNPVEPILAGRPVIVGPYMQNFHEVVTDLVQKRGIIQIPSHESLREAVNGFLNDPAKGAEQAARGKAAMETHHGAAQRTADWILE